MDNIPRLFFGICGNATALFLFLSPLVTFRGIIQTKSTQQFSGVPYAMTLLNCLLSAWYGLPFVSPHNILVVTINGIGVVVEGIYVVMFIVYAPKKVKLQMTVLLVLLLVVFASISMVSVFVIHDHKIRKLVCGFAATIFSICMYSSPLSVMKLVIQTKSVEYMPFFLSLFVFLCGTSWFVYGLLGRDPFLAVPNGFGCVLGALQLILYAIYRNPKGEVVGHDGTNVMDTTTTTTTCGINEEDDYCSFTEADFCSFTEDEFCSFTEDDDFIELGFEKPLQKAAAINTTAATCDDSRIDIL